MRLAETTINQVRQFQGIVEVISDYVPLKKRGRNHVGLCPFHSEKSPSFTVSAEKQIWHCFGCHESGDLIAFVQKIDNLTFAETIRIIADRAGIEVIEDESNSNYSRQDDEDRKKVLEFLHALNAAFQASLKTSVSTQSYLKDRKLSHESIEQFQLGYADSSLNLIALAKEKGLPAQLLPKTGVVYQTDQGAIVSRFKNRLIFPVLDYQGRTVGFGGRVMAGNNSAAKYVNSEENPVFIKRNLIYGLYWAKRGIKAAGSILLMEGYMDVITAHQFGFTQSVASMGTAVTQSQAQKLKRFSDTIYLALDNDEAGQTAIERSFETLHQVGFKVLIVQLSEKDPADFLQENGPEAFQACIEAAESMVMFKFKRVLKRVNPTRIEQVPEILQTVIPFLRLEKDPIIQRHYVTQMAIILKIDEDLIMAKLSKTRYNVGQRLEFSKRATKSRFEKAEEVLLYLMVSNLSLREAIKEKLSLDEIVTQNYKFLATEVYQSTKQNIELFEDISEENASLLRRIVVEVEQKELAEEVTQNWETYVDTVKSYHKEIRIKQIKDRLKELDQKGREEDVITLLEELQKLKFK